MTLVDSFEAERPRLLNVAYRLTGSAADAEDAVQEAWLRLHRTDARIDNLQAWLTTVVSRLCLDRLTSAAARRETYVGQWLPEPIVTMVDVDTVVIYPNMADNLRAHAVTFTGDELVVDDEQSFFTAAAKAMGIDTLHQIDTGLDPVTAEREQWDDGNNTLAIGPRLAVAYERNEQTNARLEEHGIEVVAISGSELGSGRGGPRCMSCPIERD